MSADRARFLGGSLDGDEIAFSSDRRPKEIVYAGDQYRLARDVAGLLYLYVWPKHGPRKAKGPVTT